MKYTYFLREIKNDLGININLKGLYENENNKFTLVHINNTYNPRYCLGIDDDIESKTDEEILDLIFKNLAVYTYIYNNKTIVIYSCSEEDEVIDSEVEIFYAYVDGISHKISFGIATTYENITEQLIKKGAL